MKYKVGDKLIINNNIAETSQTYHDFVAEEGDKKYYVVTSTHGPFVRFNDRRFGWDGDMFLRYEVEDKIFEDHMFKM